ncbi:OsmC family protein [Paludisphaera mucosa]|uniref:OsmC family protein n=1 Tax=Paludisphaera mucosa TaxID=3030827 RepID=A0ABT6FEI9_9BACT|nr:OsmC family protein [Paludisphaera mucosa]MDG3005988.1 OsmC family protein [Paludisphaera mucosa]
MHDHLRRIVAYGLAALVWAPMTSRALLAQATHASQDWAQTPGAFADGDSLRDFQTRLRSALFLLRDRAEAGQTLRLSASVTAEGRTGIRRLRIRNFQILSDGGRETAEFELGAGSWPSVVAAMGSAAAGDFLTQAAIKGIPLDELEVVFTSRPGVARSQGGGATVVYPQALAYTAFIVSPASDEELEALRATVERLSPVLNLVAQPQDIDHGRLIYTQTPAVREGKTLGGLREFLEDKYAASHGAKPPEGRGDATPRARDDGRPPLRAHVKVEGGTGVRNIRTDVKNFQVVHDYPRYLAGHDLGAVPEEHILGTMITCLTHIYEIEAARKQLALDSLELEVAGTLTGRLGNTSAPLTYKDIHYTVRIGSPESREKIEDLQRGVEAVCPIYNMLKNSQPIAGRVVRGPYSEEKEREATKQP